MAARVSCASGFPSSLPKSQLSLILRSRRPVRGWSQLNRMEAGAVAGGNAAVNMSSGGGPASSKVRDPPETLELFHEDGCGRESVIDYLDASRVLMKPDGGPPRWFCPAECRQPIKGAPLLLFLPGIEGVGLGLILHQKALGMVFEVWCLNIHIDDQTPFEGLVEFVESMVRIEHAASPNKPIYIVGDSFGGCLALAVAARNPSIDLVLVLSNPATSFGRSSLQLWFPALEALPNELHETVCHLSSRLTSMLPRLLVLAEIIPKETLLWKHKLLKSASSYANSRLHAVKAEVLVLASGNDKLFPSKDEAERLYNTLPSCKVRYFKDSGHTLLLEDGINMLTLLKGANMYRRSRRRDYVSDFLPPSAREFQAFFGEKSLARWFNLAISPVFFSTLKNGEIVRGLAGVPDEGPVLLVGCHMLLGLELASLVESFLKEKNIMIRAVAQPAIFSSAFETSLQEVSPIHQFKVLGAVPVSASNMHKLFSSNSFILMYPGGLRESFHRKVSRDNKLFLAWHGIVV